MKLPKFVRATVVNRPSKVVKSPYMADIIVPGKILKYFFPYNNLNPITFYFLKEYYYFDDQLNL